MTAVPEKSLLTYFKVVVFLFNFKIIIMGQKNHSMLTSYKYLVQAVHTNNITTV